jgi:integrase
MGQSSTAVKTVETGDMTIAEVIVLIEADTTLDLKRRRDLASSLRTFCNMVGGDPSTVVANPAQLRERLKQAPPGVRRSDSRIANIKSNSLAALKHVGIAIMPGRATEPLSPDWENLKTKLEGRAARYALSRFMSYCTARQIAPDQVNAGVFDQFRQILETQSLVKNPHDLHRTACLHWNMSSEAIPEWPDHIVPVPSKSRRYALDWETFQATLVEDVEAYLGRLGNRDIFSGDYRKSSSPKTIALRRSQLRLIATALVRSGIPIETITDLSVLTAPTNATLALQFFYKRAGEKKTTTNYELACLLLAIARHWKTPDPNDNDAVNQRAAQVEALGELAHALKVVQTGMTKKNRARLRQFDDIRNLEGLLLLPDRVFHEEAKRQEIGYRDAVRAMRALAVAILTYVPIRIENVVPIDLTQQIVRTRVGADAVVHLVIQENDVKNDVPIELPLPPHVVALVDTYLARYRSRLFSGASPWLFPNELGQCRQIAGFGKAIGEFIHDETGIRMNPHLFRHLCAKLHREANPNDFESIRRLLGHKRLETTVRFYATLDTKEAFRRWDATLDGLREGALKPRPGRGRKR